MGREVRMVPQDWKHPRGTSRGYKPLHDGYNKQKKEWDECLEERGYEAAVEWMNEVKKEDYMPDFPKEERTHYQMYENVSEGTPISPPLPTKEMLAQWLTDNNASSFGQYGRATYEQWFAAVSDGYVPSFVMTGAGSMGGVESAKHFNDEDGKVLESSGPSDWRGKIPEDVEKWYENLVNEE